MSTKQVSKYHYFNKKYDNLNRFISYYYQIDIIRSLNARNILEIGKGNGLVSNYLKKSGLKIKTVDFDENLNPDYVADVRDLSNIKEEFDTVVAFEILEHIPFKDFKQALKEISRISKKYVLISLPYRSTGFEFIFKFPFIRTLFKKDFLRLFYRISLRFKGFESSGQHYWEIDSGKWKLRKIRKVLKEDFNIFKEVSPPLDSFHYFFVLEKKDA